MPLQALKDRFKKQIADGHTPSVLDELKAILSDDSEYFNKVITRSGNLQELENQLIGGFITRENLEVAKANIDHAILLLIDNLTEDDLNKTNIPQLEKLIAALKLAPLPKIKLVDCNRDNQYKDYSNAFRTLRKLSYQFYFITAQTPDQPANFAERIVYEIIERTKDDKSQAISFPHRICPKTAVQRVDFTDLPFDDWGDLADNQGLFRKHFAERMKLFNLESTSIEDFVSANTKRLPYRYFTFLFRIDFDKYGWISELTEYLQWIISIFKTNPSNEPFLTFQFAFIIDSEKTNVMDNVDIKTGIDNVLTGANDAEKQPAFWLNNFTHIPHVDLKNWFTDMTKQQFQPQIKNIIAKATVGLEKPDEPNMADLEELFFTVYNVSQKI